MAAGQANEPNQLVYFPAAGSTDQRRAFKRLGDMVGVASMDAQPHTPRSVQTNVRSLTHSIAASEEWKLGREIYWNETAELFTELPSHSPVGWASANQPPATNVVKAAGVASAEVAVRPDPTTRDVLFTFDFGLMPQLAAQGSYVLRNYAAADIVDVPVGKTTPGEDLPTAQIVSGWYRDDGTVAPGTATIALGTLADPDAIMVATLVSTLSGGGAWVKTALTLAATTIPATEVVMTIAANDITAGTFQIYLENGNFKG